MTKAGRSNKKKQFRSNNKKLDGSAPLITSVNIRDEPQQKNKLIEFINNQPIPPKIVLLVPFNDADTSMIK